MLNLLEKWEEDVWGVDSEAVIAITSFAQFEWNARKRKPHMTEENSTHNTELKLSQIHN